jgi:hypothetical protein
MVNDGSGYRLTVGTDELVHVVFPLDVGGDGWPPVVAERVWAYDLGGGRFRIDNPPWFVRNLAVGDIVEAQAPATDQHPVFTSLITPSSHLTIRIICFRSGPLQGSLQAVLDRFVPLGVYAEGVAQYGMVALDIPPQADKRQVYAELMRGSADGSWEWEEGRIDDGWEATKTTQRQRFWRRGDR